MLTTSRRHQQIVRRSETAPAVQVKSAPWSPSNKQLLPSLPLAISGVRVLHLDTIKHSCFVHPSFSQNSVSSPVRAAWQHLRTRAPTTGHHRSISTGTPTDKQRNSGTEVQREESREWSVFTKEEPRSGNGTSAKNAKDEEARSVLPRGSVIQQNITKLASIATRSTAAQTMNPVSDGSSLLHRLTSTATKSTATQTSNSVLAGSGAPLKGNTGWNSKVQHSIQQTLEPSRDPSRRSTARSPTAVLEQLRDRIRSISQDMHALNMELLR